MPIKKQVNKDFFKKWSFEMAYVLGFFFADGSYDINPRGSEYFSFQITDKKLLLEIQKAIRSDHKISVRPKKNERENIQYRLQVGSKEMCKDLRKFGISQQKAETISFPSIPRKYLSTFIRGYFDGDGHVWSGIIHKHRKTMHQTLQTGFTSCSEKFLYGVHSRLQLLGIQGGGIYCKKEAFCLKYSTADSLRLYEIMYAGLKESPLFLSRKQEIFKKFKNCGGKRNLSPVSFG